MKILYPSTSLTGTTEQTGALDDVDYILTSPKRRKSLIAKMTFEGTDLEHGLREASKGDDIDVDITDGSHDCNLCAKTFAQLSQLQLHKQQAHSNPSSLPNGRPFACLRCKLKFRRRDHLLTHMRTHATYKPYTCEFCPRKFARNCDRVQHLNMKHGGNASSSGKADTDTTLKDDAIVSYDDDDKGDDKMISSIQNETPVQDEMNPQRDEVEKHVTEEELHNDCDETIVKVEIVDY